MVITLQTERLLLRPLGPGDRDTTHAYAGDRGNARYMLHLPNDTLEETVAFLAMVSADWAKEAPENYEFAITLDGRHIGAISVTRYEGGADWELGWILHRDYWGHGYATEAAAAIRDFAFQQLGVQKLVAHCDARNRGSFRVMERIGMTLESDDGVRTNRGEQTPSRELRYSLEHQH